MTDKGSSWGRSNITPKSSKVTVHVKSASGGWSAERLTPKNVSSTKCARVSYAGMTIIRRNGKK